MILTPRRLYHIFIIKKGSVCVIKITFYLKEAFIIITIYLKKTLLTVKKTAFLVKKKNEEVWHSLVAGARRASFR